MEGNHMYQGSSGNGGGDFIGMNQDILQGFAF